MSARDLRTVRARSYSSPQRREQANATRRSILAAAADLFAERGYAAVSMGRIAEVAGVSLPTVYLHFSGKAAIVAAMADEVSSMPDLSVERFERETDPIRQLQLGAAIIRQLNERAWHVAEVLRSARGTDKSIEQVWIDWQDRHIHAVQRAMIALANKGALRQDLTLDEAVDTFYVLAGTDVYRSLVQDRGRSPDQYEAWLFGIACRELLVVTGNGGGT
jgi:AcrR family transcriptional regulator